MAKTYIGVDVDHGRLHMVCLEQGADGLFVRAIAGRDIDGIDRAAEIVAEVVHDWGGTTPRLAAALPSDRLLSRIVDFPFSDPRKIAAALPLELGAQLPIDLDEYLVTAIAAGHDDDRFRWLALAVPEAEVEQFLVPFDRHQLPLRVLEVAPFADLYLLNEGTVDAILVTIRESGYVVSRVEDGVVESYRRGLLTDMHSDEDLAAVVVREIRLLSVQASKQEMPVLLCGSGLTPARQRALIDRLPGARIPDVAFEAGRLQAAYLPALALARRAAVPEKKAGYNLRQGRHAFRGSLAPFRRQLLAISVLFALTMVAVLSGLWFGYAGKAGELERLDRTLQTIYKQSFPRSPLPADVPLYMASNLAGLREESRLLGAAQIGPLQTLEAVTRGVGSDTGIDVKEFGFDAEGATLHGRAASFDAVDQLAARFRQQAVFAQVQIGDAKMSVDGSRVDFRVDFDFDAAGESHD